MKTKDKSAYTLTDKRFFERLDFYTPNDKDFLSDVQHRLPAHWRLTRSGIWFHCTCPKRQAAQGWKIHLSATPTNARELLMNTAGILMQRNVAFKFLLDRFIVRLVNSRGWPRGNAGKFITVYPADVEECQSLLDVLTEHTAGFKGPFILSDRRYKDSGVVYYRYGSFVNREQITLEGRPEPIMVSPDGRVVADYRKPVFFIPDWVQDPFVQPDNVPESDNGDLSLHGGRYKITKALAFKNSGGVYLGVDDVSQQTVVVKEARPLTGWSANNRDAISSLQKEHDLLSALAGTGICPAVIGFFQEWEHWFLVQEHIEGHTVGAYCARHNVLLRHNPSTEAKQAHYSEFKRLFTAIADQLTLLHSHGIVFGDLSPNNIIIRADGSGVRFIDFEGAETVGATCVSPLVTEGFFPSDVERSREVTFYRDYYGLGALMLAFMFPINAVTAVCPEARFRFLDALANDLCFPGPVTEMIRSLLSDDPAERPDLKSVCSVLANYPEIEVNFRERETLDYASTKATVADIYRFALHTATVDREDRLFPADTKVFQTNPLNISHGACGVAYALMYSGVTVPVSTREWILGRLTAVTAYPPGLCVGLGGIVWVLADMGYSAEAQALADVSTGHPLLGTCPDLFYGVAGWGLSQLRLYAATQDERYLQNAIRAGDELSQRKVGDERGSHWPSMDHVYFGYGHGAAGIALFLLYLFIISGNEQYLALGMEALRWELANGINDADGGLTWSQHLGVVSPTLPYLRFGSAGVGAVLARYQAVAPSNVFETALKQIVIDTDRRYTVFPGYFDGLSGLGHFMLDMYDLTGGPEYLDKAHKIATGIKLFEVSQPEGVAYPGNTLQRLSCDFGTGSSGIATYLSRLHQAQAAPFTLDGFVGLCALAPRGRLHGQVSEVRPSNYAIA